MTETVKWALAPIEPTSEMCRKGQRALTAHAGYKLMLAAAPPAPDVVGVLEEIIKSAVDDDTWETDREWFVERARALLDQLRVKDPDS